MYLFFDKLLLAIVQFLVISAALTLYGLVLLEVLVLLGELATDHLGFNGVQCLRNSCGSIASGLACFLLLFGGERDADFAYARFVPVREQGQVDLLGDLLFFVKWVVLWDHFVLEDWLVIHHMSSVALRKVVFDSMHIRIFSISRRLRIREVNYSFRISDRCVTII